MHERGESGLVRPPKPAAPIPGSQRGTVRWRSVSRCLSSPFRPFSLLPGCKRQRQRESERGYLVLGTIVRSVRIFGCLRWAGSHFPEKIGVDRCRRCDEPSQTSPFSPFVEPLTPNHQCPTAMWYYNSFRHTDFWVRSAHKLDGIHAGNIIGNQHGRTAGTRLKMCWVRGM